MNYKELKDKYIRDPNTRLGTLEAFHYFDDMDVIKAMNALDQIKHMLQIKWEELNDNSSRGA